MSYLPSKPKHSLVHILLDHPALTRAQIAYVEEVMRGDSPFSALDRETVFAFCSGLNNCGFCETSHTITVEILGGEKGLVRDLVDDPNLINAPENLRPVLAYARKLTLRPSSVGQTDIDAILEAGWSETALVHLANVVGLANLFNRIVEGLGVPNDPDMVAMGGKMMAEDGYMPIIERLKEPAE
ncbi:MAG: peroxidase [Alphaproteobacteria bacterium]|jgi:uncharacterized peroxidase-related enzyme